MKFCDALISAYREEACRVLPNAIWKTLAEVDNFETSFEVENKVVMRLEMWDYEDLRCKDRTWLKTGEAKGVAKMLLHDNQKLTGRKFTKSEYSSGSEAPQIKVSSSAV